jgi:hypothetical protein
VIICTGLSALINTLNANRAADVKAVADFAQNFLPILFNLFTSVLPSDPIHHPSFMATMAYVSIAPPQVAATFFKQLMTRVLAPTSSLQMRISLTQLAQVFVPKLSYKELDFVFSAIRPQLSVCCVDYLTDWLAG